MEPDTFPPHLNDRRLEAAWRDHHHHLEDMARRLLRDEASAEDVVQDAFGRLVRADLDEIVDIGGWLAVVVRRLCIDMLRSAAHRRESAVGSTPLETGRPVTPTVNDDPADRVTLDDQVQLALAVVLDRLTPAERTAFVLHDVFGFPFDAVGEIVGRTPAACRQLATRARRRIRDDASRAITDTEVTEHQIITERFIRACAGGDMTELLAVLDPDVVGDATVVGRGPLRHVEGAHEVAVGVLALFGPRSAWTLLPVPLEGEAGLVVLSGSRVVAFVSFATHDGVIHHIRAFIQGG